MLRTFGFVSDRQTERALSTNDDDDGDSVVLDDVTEAVVSKEDVLASCRRAIERVEKRRTNGEEELDDDDDRWDPSVGLDDVKIPFLRNETPHLPDRMSVVSDLDEIVTCCVILTLDPDTFREFVGNDDDEDGGGVLRADDLLGGGGGDDDDNDDGDEDDLLTTCVALALCDLVESAVGRYDDGVPGPVAASSKRDRDALRGIVRSSSSPPDARARRRAAGLVVRLEEKRSLAWLRRRALRWIEPSRRRPLPPPTTTA